MGEHAHTSFELSHLPTPLALDICIDLACKPTGRHVDLLPQPLSPRFVDPLNCTMLCSSILDSTLVVNEDQVVDRVGVVQPTCTIILDKCVRESKEESIGKDESLPPMPHLLYPDIHCDYAIVDFPCEN